MKRDLVFEDLHLRGRVGRLPVEDRLELGVVLVELALADRLDRLRLVAVLLDADQRIPGQQQRLTEAGLPIIPSAATDRVAADLHRPGQRQPALGSQVPAQRLGGRIGGPSKRPRPTIPSNSASPNGSALHLTWLEGDPVRQPRGLEPILDRVEHLRIRVDRGDRRLSALTNRPAAEAGRELEHAHTWSPMGGARDSLDRIEAREEPAGLRKAGKWEMRRPCSA